MAHFRLLESQNEKAAALVQVLSCVLTRLVTANDRKRIAGRPITTTKFHAQHPPRITVRDYLKRIHKYANCSPECFVLGLVYIDRFIKRNNVVLTSLNIHRLLITSIMLAAKFFDDQYFNNAYYAQVGGVPADEMNSLELEFLFSVNFSLHVTTGLYKRYESELCKHISGATRCGCNECVSALVAVDDALEEYKGDENSSTYAHMAAAAECSPPNTSHMGHAADTGGNPVAAATSGGAPAVPTTAPSTATAPSATA